MNVRKSVVVLLTLALCLAFPVSALSETKGVLREDNRDVITEVTFIDGFSNDELIDLVKTKKLKIEKMVVIDIIEDRTYTTFFLPNNENSFEYSINAFEDLYKAMLLDSLELSNNMSSIVYKDTQSLLEKFRKNRNSMNIKRITLRNDKGKLLDNRNNAKIEKVKVYQIPSDKFSLGNSSNFEFSRQAPRAAASSTSNWLPTAGEGHAWPSRNTTDATYMELTYSWASASEITALTGDNDATLEGEIIFYNYDDTALATEWHPDGAIYSTNQPRPYIDTQAFDNSDEPRFTVGASDASQFEANTDYYWRAYGNLAHSTGSNAKIYFQRGHRVINWIYEETWNIFQDETIIVVPFSDWDLTTTGVGRW